MNMYLEIERPYPLYKKYIYNLSFANHPPLPILDKGVVRVPFYGFGNVKSYHDLKNWSSWQSGITNDGSIKYNIGRKFSVFLLHKSNFQINILRLLQKFGIL